MSIDVAIFCLPIIVVLLLARVYRARTTINHRLPPGPPPDPIIGHLRLFAGNNSQEELFYELSKAYGDIVYLRIMGKDIVILNSEEIAKELLEKRGASYSNRPSFYFYTEIGWKNALTFLQYDGNKFALHRRLTQQPFASQRMAEYEDIQEREVGNLLENLLKRPAEYERHIHFMISAIMLDIIYGHHLTSDDDEHLKIIEDVTSFLMSAKYVPLFDFLPPLQYLPERIQRWFSPSISDTKRILRHVIDYPFETVVRQLVEGKATPSITSLNLEALHRDGQASPEDYNDIRIAASALLIAGTETSWSTIQLFIACMVLHPEVQKKAHEEIDRVIGNTRLPAFADRESLPYVNAVMQETMRWHPAVPSGIAHQSIEDDEYRGMFIPKGATIIPNVLSMALDENVYKDAHLFKPDRFLSPPDGSGEPFSTSIVWGFGRRKCPGQNLADANIWLAVAQILAVFEISAPKDDAGNEVDIGLKFLSSGGLVSYPAPFKCDIRPRNDKVIALVHKN